MKIITLGIDLAKNIFQLHGVDKRGKVVLSQRVKRERLVEVIANLPACLIGMEACRGSHYFAREFEKLGHTVKLMSAGFVKPYVKTNKNDQRDAEGICEAVSRPSMRFVPIKTVEQQDIQAVHRCRSLLIKNRTALINQTRGLLAEYGIVIAQSAEKVRRTLPTLLDEENELLTSFSKETFRELYSQLVDLDDRIDKIDLRLRGLFEAHPVCQKIAAIPGVRAADGDGACCRDRRSKAFSKRTTSCGLARVSSSATFQWREDRSRRDLEAGEPLLADALNSWRAARGQSGWEEERCYKRLD